MFTNKRQIKKYIDRVCSDIAELLLPAAVYTGGITDEAAEDILIKVSELKAQAHARLSIAYDKAPDAFDSMRAYHTGRRRYYKEAYGKAIADFEKGVEEAIAPLNAKK